MAKFKMNKMVEGATGKVGNMVFRQVGRTTLFTQAPERGDVVATEAQIAQRLRFKHAINFAKQVLLLPEEKALYEAQATGDFDNAFNLAVQDYMAAPKIDSVKLTDYSGQINQPLNITVFESAKVTAATVTITRADNTVVESGALNRLPDSFEWQYMTTQVNAVLAGTKITFTITDAEGNTHVVNKTL
jgi:hypothetical protein